MEIWQYLLLFGVALGGGSVAFYIPKYNKRLLDILLSFSGAFILGITFLHLLPEVYAMRGYDVGMYIIIGFLIQVILEQFSKGIEHGHIHVGHHTNWTFVVSVMIGLCFHAFIEGLPLSGYVLLENHVHNHLLYGILFHKLPASFALGLLLLLSGFRKSVVIICLVIFSLMSPLGAGVAAFLQTAAFFSQHFMVIVIAIVVGSFLHIATTILFETDSAAAHRLSALKLLVIIGGFGAALLTMHSH